MSDVKFSGVMPAITAALDEDLSVDPTFVAKQVRWLVEHGSTGIVPLGCLGEGATLIFDEKCDIVRSCVSELGDSAPVVPGIASLSTSETVRPPRLPPPPSVREATIELTQESLASRASLG